jgi:lipopolysaccharide export system protein LptA
MSYARLPKQAFLALLGAVILASHALNVYALSSDRGKPATIEADEVEFDFRTGKRTYKGNVIVVQGTLRITGDKMVVQYDQDSEQIESATSWGEPATFKQRPDGKEHDVYGEGETIILNEMENTLTLIENASMTQAGNTAKGREIVYDMATDKMTVKGMHRQQTGGETVTNDEETGRARVIITPEEQTSSSGGNGEESGEETDSENKSDSEKQSE